MKTVSITLLIFLLSFYSQAQNIRFIDSFSHHTDGSTRYVIVLENEEMYWRAPGQSWKQVTKEGLPSGTIDNFSTHSKPDGTRYIVTINGNRIFWRAAGESWNEVSNDGLPAGFKIVNLASHVKLGGETRYVIVLSTGDFFWKAPGQGWLPVPTDGLPK